MARTELVKFRVTPAEKAHIVTQAGGARQVSEHLRGLALRGYKDGGGEQQAETSEVAPLSSAAQPSARADLPSPATEGVQVHDGPDAVLAALEGRGAESLSGSADGPRASSAEECPRWMHHRSGTYCGSCKTVPK